MTGPEYQSALSTLSLTPDQAAIWLGIGRSTAYRYLKTGCEGAVERALSERLNQMWRTIESAPDAEHGMFVVQAFEVRTFGGQTYTSDPVCVWRNPDGTFARWKRDFEPTHWLPLPKYISHSDLTAAAGLSK